MYLPSYSPKTPNNPTNSSLVLKNFAHFYMNIEIKLDGNQQLTQNTPLTRKPTTSVANKSKRTYVQSCCDVTPAGHSPCHTQCSAAVPAYQCCRDHYGDCADTTSRLPTQHSGLCTRLFLNALIIIIRRRRRKSSKLAKYASLSAAYLVQPIALETLGPINE